MDTFDLPDWDTSETVLVEEGNAAIRKFAARHPNEQCSFFAFSVDYCFGDIAICFDTIDNSILHARRHEAQATKSRAAAFAGERGWENAKYYIQRDRLCSHSPHTANFKYPDFATLRFPEWEEYYSRNRLPESPDPLGHVIVILHKAICRMSASRTFDQLTISSPFRVGAEFPRDDLGLVVMKLLNWPPHQGPRA